MIRLPQALLFLYFLPRPKSVELKNSLAVAGQETEQKLCRLATFSSFFFFISRSSTSRLFFSSAEDATAAIDSCFSFLCCTKCDWQVNLTRNKAGCSVSNANGCTADTADPPPPSLFLSLRPLSLYLSLALSLVLLLLFFTLQVRASTYVPACRCVRVSVAASVANVLLFPRC